MGAASGRSAACQAAMPPSSTDTCSKPAFFSALAALDEAVPVPVRHTSTTGDCLAEASSLCVGVSWAGCTLRLPVMWPFSKSLPADRSITTASPALIRRVSSAGLIDL